MEFLEEFSTTADDWYTINSMFVSFRTKTSYKWDWVKDEDIPGEEFRELVEKEEMPEGREYQKQFSSFYRAIKSLEKRGLVRLEQIPKNERESCDYARVKVFPTDKILSV